MKEFVDWEIILELLCILNVLSLRWLIIFKGKISCCCLSSSLSVDDVNKSNQLLRCDAVDPDDVA